MLLPELGKAQHFPGLFAFAQVGSGIAHYLALGFLRQKGQNRFLTAAALGQIMPLHKLIGAEKGNRMEIQVKALAFEQLLFPEGLHPTGPKGLQDGRPDAIGEGR